MNRYRVKLYTAALLAVLVSANVESAVAQRAPWVGDTLDGKPCSGGDPGNYGPWDYRTDKERFGVVGHHFTEEVEQLRRGVNNEHPMGDVNFALVRVPNHHRALYSAVRFSLGDSKYDDFRGYTAECYLQRAINFRPDDWVPYMLFGLYLHRLGQLNESLEQYRAAESLEPNDANLLYNMGLVYFDNGNYEESLRYAKAAYGRGIVLPGLRQKLQDAGHWE